MSKEIVVVTNGEEANRLVATYGGQAASRSLEHIASKDGDEALMNVVSGMDLHSLCKVVRHHDDTIPSIIPWLMSSDEIVDLVKVEPSYWEGELTGTNTCVQKDVQAFISQLFLSHDDEAKKTELLSAIGSDQNGVFFLSVPFFGTDISEQSEEDGPGINFDEEQLTQSPEALIALIRDLNYYLYTQICETVEGYSIKWVTDKLKGDAVEMKVGDTSGADDMFSVAPA